MYLTRVELNVRRRETMSALASPERVHASVMAGFPAIGREDGRILWRIDDVGQSTFLLVQSPGVPDFTHVIEQFGWPASKQGWDTIDCDEFLSGIKEGDIRRFRLTANPVRAVPAEGGGRGKVCHHVTAAQQIDWLLSRSLKNGFIVDANEDDRCSVTIASRGVLKFRHGRETITLSKVIYEGVLKVADPDALKKAMAQGIGRGKAYGCGMLSVSRV